MNTQAPAPQRYAFDFPRLDTTVEVEPSGDGAIIRASRHSFSEERKHSFIRELAAEGFIDEACLWRQPGSPDGVRWIVDATEFMPGPAARARTRRFMLRLIFSSVGLLWLLIASFLIPGVGR